jgi:hypothetical protein
VSVERRQWYRPLQLIVQSCDQCLKFFRDEVFEGDFMMGDHDSKYIHYKITVQLFHGGYGV